MTELIPGRRYRFTGEGIADVNGDGIEVGDWYIPVREEPFAPTVELISDPLPTTPGSVIRAHDTIYVRREPRRTDYPWVDLNGDIFPDSAVVGAIVLFDAGAA